MFSIAATTAISNQKIGHSRLMTLPECVVAAGVSRRFLEMEIKRGRLRATKLSNRICRIRVSDWEKYLDAAATIAAAA